MSFLSALNAPKITSTFAQTFPEYRDPKSPSPSKAEIKKVIKALQKTAAELS